MLWVFYISCAVTDPYLSSETGVCNKLLSILSFVLPLKVQSEVLEQWKVWTHRLGCRLRLLLQGFSGLCCSSLSLVNPLWMREEET